MNLQGLSWYNDFWYWIQEYSLKDLGEEDCSWERLVEGWGTLWLNCWLPSRLCSDEWRRLWFIESVDASGGDELSCMIGRWTVLPDWEMSCRSWWNLLLECATFFEVSGIYFLSSLLYRFWIIASEWIYFWAGKVSVLSFSSFDRCCRIGWCFWAGDAVYFCLLAMSALLSWRCCLLLSSWVLCLLSLDSVWW